MGVKSDWEDLKEMWPRVPWWYKGGQILLLFLSISSIASLAEKIVEWRGFLRDSMEFYHRCISEPLRELFSVFDLHASTVQSSLFIILGLMTGSVWRLLKANNFGGATFVAVFFFIVDGGALIYDIYKYPEAGIDHMNWFNINSDIFMIGQVFWGVALFVLMNC